MPMSSVPPPQVGDASRVALARLALDVVSTIPGVAGTDAGPGGLCVTADPRLGVLRGVSVIAQPDGRYEVDLCLVARIVPLVPLGDDIRRQLRARAAREGLADQLGAVNVGFARALSAGETMVEVAEVAVRAEGVQVTAGSPIPPPVSTGSQIPVPAIPPAGRSGVPDEPPAPSGTPLSPRPAPAQPPQPAPAAPSGPSAVPEEPTGSIGSQTPSSDPAGSPIPPPGSAAGTPSPDREPQS
jgi:hypothetical protein